MTTNNALEALQELEEQALGCGGKTELQIVKLAETIRAALLDAPSCPMGDDCDLTIAYMKGYQDGKAECDAISKDLERVSDNLHAEINDAPETVGGTAGKPTSRFCEDTCTTCAQSRQSAGVPDGWKLVPIEPTGSMIVAFNDALDGRRAWVTQVRLGLTASIKAAQQPPAGGVDVDSLKIETRVCLGEGNIGYDPHCEGWNDCIDHLHQRGLIGGGWIEDTLIAAYETGEPDKVWEVVEKHLIDREPKRHRWAGEGEKCPDCGESDWYAGPVCTPPAGQEG